MKKIYTIWKFALVFGLNREDCDRKSKDSPDNIIYAGSIDDIPDSIAEAVAEIHPNAPQYYADAMMPLYKGYGWLKSGTENPNLAIGSRRSVKEVDAGCEYVVIWKMFDEASQYPQAVNGLDFIA